MMSESEYYKFIEYYKSAIKALIFLMPIFIFATSISALTALTYSKNIFKVAYMRIFSLFLGFSSFGVTLGTMSGYPKDSLIEQLVSPFLAFLTATIAFVTNREASPKLKFLTPGAIVVFLGCFMFSFFYCTFAPD